MTDNDFLYIGGPAFPHGKDCSVKGLYMCDYFAAQIIGTLIGNGVPVEEAVKEGYYAAIISMKLRDAIMRNEVSVSDLA